MDLLPWLLLCCLSFLQFNFSAQQKEPVGQNLIILLIDGFSATLFNETDSREKFGTKTLLENGVEAHSLKPVFPTQTYPNWFSLATGLYVESHNFTADFMFDSEHSALFQRDRGANDSDARWWTANPPPFWYAVGKAGADVHCYWFSTCHKAHVDLIVQVPANRRHSFNKTMDTDLFPHLPKIMKHLSKYQVYRQQLVLLRYDGLGKALRESGVNSDETVQALSNVDQQIRKIQEEMENWNLQPSTNFMVLSDHGLMEVREPDQFYIEECLEDYSKVRQLANSLAFTMIWPVEGEEDTIFFELKVCDQWAAAAGDDDSDNNNNNEQPLVSVYRRHEIPDHFHWKESRFMAPIVLIARPGVVLLSRQIPSTDVSEKFGREWKMLDGWDNEREETHGIFMARGPAFKSGYQGEQIEIVDIYQLVLNMLGVDPTHQSNGSWDRISEFLGDGLEERRYEPQNFATRTVLPPVAALIVSIVAEIALLLAFTA